MSIPTVAVTCTAYDQNGNAVAGGTFRARLNSTEIYNGFVVPEQVTGVADASGVCVLQLWPNALGVAGSAYRITAINPDTGQKYLDTTAVVPNSACNLHQIIVAAPYPTVDASQQALVAAQGALAAVTAQAGIATTKAAEASASATTAATQAGIATTQAGTATTQAGIATTQATTATTQADIAAIQAGIATTKASEASASAATATTQAGTATTKASEAAASAATATTQAGTATTQAGVATTKASEAAASATNASNSAYTAGLSVDAAVTAKNQAVSSASAAASSATAASGSATAASTSASSASASASTATTQAGTATTQAGLATTAATTATSKASEASTYASNASASANTSTTQAGVATTQAGIATTQAGVATTQAGIAIANANAALSVYGSVTAQQASVTAAQNAATSATASAAAANSSAGNASGSAASALAIYGTTAAQQAALMAAQSAASLAQGYALSASSAIQQDLSGVTAQALHRSPNAVTAMFVYDTSKDSDGGAWTEKCQHTSWYNEALNGKWLGAHEAEFQARSVGGVLGTELITNGTFNTDTTGWTAVNANLSAVNGVLRVTKTAVNGQARTTVPTVIGKVYRVEATLANRSTSAVVAHLDLGTSAGGTQYARTAVAGIGVVSGSATVYFTATATTAHIGLYSPEGTGFEEWDNISVREVTALTTASGDYYQSTVDGKFYRLWKNLLTFSEQFDNAAWTKTNATITANSVVAPNGTTTADKLVEDTATSTHRFDRSFTFSAVPHTASIYLKAAERSWALVRFGPSALNINAYFDLSAGVTGTVGAGATSATITPVGNGWYRCSISGTPTAVSDFGLIVFTATANGTVSYTGDGTSGIYIWGAQLEQGSTATAYEAKTVDSSITETFRGNKADFPRLAGIVCSGTASSAMSVAIYDLTEPGRPMWMVFAPPNNTSNIGYNLWTLSSGYQFVAAHGLSGLLCLAMPVNTIGGGLVYLDFAKDTAGRIYQDTVYGGIQNGGIAQRNVVNNLITRETRAVANRQVNAVAMTVLPDAPVDAVTGLQVPTIAVATAGGVSVIKHNGTVVNSSSTSAFQTVALTPYLLAVGSSSSTTWLYALLPGLLGTSFALTSKLTGEAPDFGKSQNGQLVVPFRGRLIRRANSANTVELLRQNENTIARSATSTITNTFNTGHLIGDIRRAYLADVDVGSVSSTELVTNGTFDTDTTGWSGFGAGGWSVVDGKAGHTTTYGALSQIVSGTVVSGRWYLIQFDATVSAGSFNVYLRNTLAGAISTSGTKRLYVIAGSANNNLTFEGFSTFVGSIDNISVKEAVADRSYKAQAASITGTLTKTQVAAASQLVAYSGFSAANYLREPYSADLDFGTGEWSASAWVNVPVTLPDASFPVVGSDLVVNGDFSAGTTGWAIESGVTVDAGAMSFATNSNQVGYQTISATAGRFFQVTLTVVSYTSGAPQVSINAGASVNIPSPSVLGLKTFLVLAGSGDAILRIRGGLFGTGGTCSIDNITVKEIASALITDRAHSSGSRVQLGVAYDGKLTATAFDGTTTRTVTTTAAYNTATWIKPEAVYTTDGTLAIRVNGVEVAATRGTPLGNMTLGKNLLTFSEQFGQSPWDLNSTTTVTSNSTTAPDGTSTADTLFENTNTSAHYVRTPTFSFVSGSSYAFSIFAKNISGGRGFIQIAVFAGFGSGANVTFNLATGTISASTHFTGSISPVGNGWYRCVAVGTATSSAAERMTISLSDGTTTSFPSYAGDITKGIYLWGAQLELGSTATDYAATNVAPLTIGNSYAADAPFPGSIALLKLSATVPTAEQSQWMYEQEKQMFRDGAQVTLPDAGSIVDLTYDDATDKWIAVSATNESEWSGLVRTSVTASPAGSYTKTVAASGIQMHARSTTNPGVDINIPSYGLREELVNRSQAAARLARNMVAFDYVGGFTANTTTGSTAITSVASLTYPVSYVGARISGAGIPANTTVVAVSGTTIYMSAAATATASGVQISFVDFTLPLGYEAREVLTAGLAKVEGSTKDFTRLFDGFKETIRFGTAPGFNAAVQIQATRSAT